MQVASVRWNDDAVAERLGAERVLADRLQHAAERRVDDAQQDQEGDGDDGEAPDNRSEACR